MLKRTLLYLTRKKGKTLTLFVLILLIAAFITTSLALMYTTEQVSEHMRQSLGGRIELIGLGGFPFSRDPGSYLKQAIEHPITAALIDEIMSIPGVSGYNARNLRAASGDGLTYMQGFYYTGEMGSILASTDSSDLTDFRENRFSLSSGRHIAPDDENTLMVSETFAAVHGLEVGDTVTLRPAYLDIGEEDEIKDAIDYFIDESAPTVETEIVGIFAEEVVQEGAAWNFSVMINRNRMFTDHATLAQLGLANSDMFDEVTFYVKDPSELPGVVSDIQQLDAFNSETIFMQHDDANFEKISGDLQTVQNLILVLLVAIGIVSAIILALMLILRMRGRVHEVGILLSVGTPKRQITGGFLLEIVFIAVVSFAVSTGLVNLILPVLSQNLLADLPALAELGTHQFQTMPAQMYALIYAAILLIILLTTYAATAITIRLKPREILTKMS